MNTCKTDDTPRVTVTFAGHMAGKLRALTKTEQVLFILSLIKWSFKPCIQKPILSITVIIVIIVIVPLGGDIGFKYSTRIKQLVIGRYDQRVPLSQGFGAFSHD